MEPTAAPSSPPSMAIPPAPADRLLHLDAIRGAAILGVLWWHAEAYARHESTSPTARFWLGLISPSVAFFFLADGFFFARSVSRRGEFRYGVYVRKSALRLLLPWAVFMTAYLLLRGVFEAIDARAGTSHFSEHRLVLGRSPVEILSHVWDSSIAMQMYFLVSLFLIRLASFATVRLVRAGAGWTLAVACGYIATRTLLGLTLGGDPVTNAIAGLQYYLLGIAFYQLDDAIRRRWGALAVGGLALWGVLRVLQVRGDLPAWAGILTQLSALVGEYALFLGIVRRVNVLVWLGRRTMEIYLLHAPVVMKAAQVVLGRFVADRGWLHVAIMLASLVGAIGLGWLIARIPGGRVVFGEAVPSG
jgi:peptidoglycan/LPS O-acetylase OafA/YrhL